MPYATSSSLRSDNVTVCPAARLVYGDLKGRLARRELARGARQPIHAARLARVPATQPTQVGVERGGGVPLERTSRPGRRGRHPSGGVKCNVGQNAIAPRSLGMNGSCDTRTAAARARPCSASGSLYHVLEYYAV